MQLIGDLRWQHGHNHRHRRLDFDADSLAIMVRLEAAIYLQEGRQLVFFFYLVHPPKLWLDAVLDAIPVVVVDVQVIGSLETARRRALGCKDSRDAYADGALGFVVRVQDGAEAGKHRLVGAIALVANNHNQLARRHVADVGCFRHVLCRA